jgi:uncharacterized membrane protein YciS (DUF1049 family)
MALASGLIVVFIVSVAAGAAESQTPADASSWLRDQLTLPNILAMLAIGLHVAWSYRDVQWLKEQILKFEDRYITRELADERFDHLRRDIDDHRHTGDQRRR